MCESEEVSLLMYLDAGAAYSLWQSCLSWDPEG